MVVCFTKGTLKYNAHHLTCLKYGCHEVLLRFLVASVIFTSLVLIVIQIQISLTASVTVYLELWVMFKKWIIKPLVFFGDFNAHHREWLSSASLTDQFGRNALDIAYLSSCDQLVSEPIHISGNRLDLRLTDFSSVAEVEAIPSIGTFHHSALSLKIQTNIHVPDVFIKMVLTMTVVIFTAIHIFFRLHALQSL